MRYFVVALQVSKVRLGKWRKEIPTIDFYRFLVKCTEVKINLSFFNCYFNTSEGIMQFSSSNSFFSLVDAMIQGVVFKAV